MTQEVNENISAYGFAIAIHNTVQAQFGGSVAKATGCYFLYRGEKWRLIAGWRRPEMPDQEFMSEWTDKCRDVSNKDHFLVMTATEGPSAAFVLELVST